MKGHREVKPIVHFQKFGRFKDYGTGVRCALVYGVMDHPYLGREEVVRTSKVVSVDNEEEPTLIETLNTIYKLKS